MVLVSQQVRKSHYGYNVSIHHLYLRDDDAVAEASAAAEAIFINAFPSPLKDLLGSFSGLSSIMLSPKRRGINHGEDIHGCCQVRVRQLLSSPLQNHKIEVL